MENTSSADKEQNTYIPQMLPLIFGVVQGKSIGLAAEMGIADILKQKPMSLEELAAATKTDTTALQRFLQLLVQLGVLVENDQKLFSCTALGKTLENRDNSSLHNYARLTNSTLVLEMLKHMRRSLESGNSTFDEIYGTSFYEAMQTKPDELAIFNGAMKEISEQDDPAILGTYDFSFCKSVVDVGGGQGFLLKALLDKYTHLQGTLFELPEIASSANDLLETQVSKGKCKVVAGDFLVTVPADGDVYILKRVLSHFPDEQALKLLSNIRSAISENGRLLIIDPDAESLYGSSFNLLMLLVIGGSGLRPKKELLELLASAGFKYKDYIRLSDELCIIDAVPV